MGEDGGVEFHGDAVQLTKNGFAQLVEVVRNLESEVTLESLPLGTSPQGQGLSRKFQADSERLRRMLNELRDQLEAIVEALHDTTQIYREVEEDIASKMRAL